MSKKQELQVVVEHLNKEDRNSILKAITANRPKVALRFDELRSSAKQYQHVFYMKHTTRMSPPTRRRPEHVSKESESDIQVMLEAQVHEPASSFWRVPILIHWN